MAIINDIVTRFSSSGQEKVAKGTQQITRAQTRLGQASASAGRQFSSQSQGLGGLVSAYAGAAATIFAITQAFDALNRAAQAEQTVNGVNALATAIGESGPLILKNLQEITKGQLSIAESAKAANLALSSGFSGQQIEELAAIATKASRALGVPLSNAFERLTRGVVKLEPELLDELGIFTRIEPAAERFASQVGKVASQLSNFEKRQAFANAVAEEGAEKFASIDVSTTTAAEQLEKFSATLQNVGKSFGNLIAGLVGPLAEFLSEPTAAIAAFGILAKTVLGTTIRELSGSLKNIGPRAQEAADSFNELTLKGNALKKANTQLAGSLNNISLKTRFVTEDRRKEFSELVRLGRAQELNRTQLKRAVELTNQSIIALQRQQSTLRKSSAEFKRLDRQITNASKAQDMFNKRLATGTIIGKNLGKAFAVVATGVGRFAGVVLGVVGTISTLITVVSLVTIGLVALLKAFNVFDPVADFLGKVKQRLLEILGLTEELREFRKIAKEIGGDISDQNFRQAASGIKAFAEATGKSVEEASKLIETQQALQGGVRLDAFREAGGQSIVNFADASQTTVTERIATRSRAGQNRTRLETRRMTEKELEDAKKLRDLKTEDLLLTNTLTELNNKLLTGTASRETLERAIAALKAASAKGTGEVLKTDRQLIQALVEQTQLQLNSEIINERISKTFSAQIKASEKLQDILLLDEEGNARLVKSKNEQVLAVNKQIDAALNVQEIEGKTAAQIAKDERNRALALQVLQGRIVEQRIEGEKLAKAAEKRNKALEKSIELTQRQNRLANLQAELKLLQTQEKIIKARAKQELTLLDIRTKQIVSLLKQQDVLADISAKFESDVLSGPLGFLATPGNQGRLELRLAQEDAARMDKLADVEIRALVERRGIAIKQQNDLKQNFDRQNELEKRAIESRFKNTKRQIELAREQEIAANKDREEKLALDKIMVKSLIDNRRGLSVIFAKHSADMRATFGGEGLGREQARERLSSAGLLDPMGRGANPGLIFESTKRQNDFNKALENFVEKNKDATTSDATRLRLVTALIAEFGKESKVVNEFIKIEKQNIAVREQEKINEEKAVQAKLNANKDQFDREVTQLKKNNEEKLIIAKEASAREIATLDEQIQKLQDAKAARDKELDAMETLLKLSTDPALRVLGETLGTIFDELQTGLTDLFTSLANGTFTLSAFKEGIGNLVNSVLQSFVGAAVENFIINPIKEALFGPMKASIIPTVGGNAQLVKIAKDPITEKNPFIEGATGGDPFGGTGGASIIEDETNGFFDNFLRKGKEIFGKLTDGFGSVFSGILSIGRNVFSGIGSILSNIGGMFGIGGGMGGGILGMVGGLFGFNSGGLVHMAQGGMMRDRIPAMLEPGEFVIRRPMAKAIGGPALGAMNATGQLPQQPVVVNIKNEGTPQEAQAERPRVDADKIVVDIVTRDLRNNGPIRQSLRGGSM
ncbi:putative pore-forming tail tip protein [uncultured virus]|uniref:Putative pore-forming tail tip protein n=1 Tax=uncultured virus TaxID=340016 RepID=A0A218MKA1_9VIRU|nr:putative pore-forming tail tip protein [uncultured virus]